MTKRFNRVITTSGSSGLFASLRIEQDVSFLYQSVSSCPAVFVLILVQFERGVSVEPTLAYQSIPIPVLLLIDAVCKRGLGVTKLRKLSYLINELICTERGLVAYVCSLNHEPFDTSRSRLCLCILPSRLGLCVGSEWLPCRYTRSSLRRSLPAATTKVNH